MKKVIKRITAVVTVLCLLCAGLFYLYVNDYYESEDKFVDGTYQSDENLLNNISTLNKHGA